MNILGLTTMTESSAVLLQDGHLVAAAEEERFTRIKHAGGFPRHAIGAVLKQAGIGLADVDAVAVYWDPYRVGHRARYLLGLAVQDPGMFREKVLRAATVWRGQAGQASGWRDLLRVGAQLEAVFGVSAPPIHYLDHHACHMACGFYSSPFDSAAVLVMDGAGEEDCTSFGTAEGLTLRTLETHRLPHSLGHFYSAITGYLGFRMLDGEYKLMGLSPYGDPGGSSWIRQHLLTTPTPGRYQLEPGVLDYHRALRGEFAGAFTRHFGPPRPARDDAPWQDRHRDVAAAAQRAFEEVVLDLARALQKRTGQRRLVIVGGCGLNGRANHRIVQEKIFEDVFVPPAPHDAGAALGAAMLLHTLKVKRRPEPVPHAGFGPSIAAEAVESALQVSGIPLVSAMPSQTQNRSEGRLSALRLPEDLLLDRTAQAIASGQIVGWVQGAMEFGPRALGARSFLADPRQADMIETLNVRIKKREPFRPFAPSVKAERASDFFALEVPSPFMSFIAPVREKAREQLAAITHVDGTARPQTVERAHLPRYWSLLDHFEALTGLPVLLNTSFNIQEPIVCTSSEALHTFQQSGADALVLGDYWIGR